ncbi:VOC family protein [Streptomyces sioyaensis]|uniref:VOC family protein n=1 Tax=Streptomyces sioyaensis TaxID=67364 RepID=UPI0037875ECE
MPAEMETITYPVKDLTGSKALFATLLGVPPYMDEPYYAAFRAGGQDVGLDPNGHRKGLTGPVGYWRVDDIERSLKALTDAGAKTVQEVQDVGGGKLIASVRDADGNALGLVQGP